MKSANRLLLSTFFVVFLGFSGLSQKKQDKYTDFDRGYAFFYYKKPDSAYQMFNRYINDAEDTLKKGTAFSYMGEILWNIGDLYGAQQNLTDAIKTLDPLNEKHHEETGVTYILLGNVSVDLKQYDEAINFYNKANIFLKGTDYLPEVMNGKAIALQKKGTYDAAILIFDSILASKPADPQLLARIIDNRARTKWLQDPNYAALPEFHSGLKIRIDSQDNRGLNASYAHLSDYYVKSSPDSALWYAHKMLEQAKENKSPDDMLEAIDKLIRLNNAPVLKQHWYEEYKILDDSLQFSRDTTKNRFALIRYDFQKSKADNLILRFEIEKRKVDNFELQRDNTRQRLLLYGFIVLAVAIFTGLIAWYNKRRKRMKQEAENAIRDARLKTSQKVHDVVANGLYGIMNELEHSETIGREPLIDKIEGLYEKSRNISYEEISHDNPADHDKQVHRLLTAFASEQTKVIIVGNGQTFWNRISSAQKQELQLILNEIMINMKKHSHAKKVVIVFKQEGHKGFITYKDDGVGFNADQKFGNGLNNTVSRIKSINGEVNFGKNESSGISITINFPLQS